MFTFTNLIFLWIPTLFVNSKNVCEFQKCSWIRNTSIISKNIHVFKNLLWIPKLFVISRNVCEFQKWSRASNYSNRMGGGVTWFCQGRRRRSVSFLLSLNECFSLTRVCFADSCLADYNRNLQYQKELVFQMQ